MYDDLILLIEDITGNLDDHLIIREGQSFKVSGIRSGHISTGDTAQRSIKFIPDVS
jgi:hypothetical protein